MVCNDLLFFWINGLAHRFPQLSRWAKAGLEIPLQGPCLQLFRQVEASGEPLVVTDQRLGRSGVILLDTHGLIWWADGDRQRFSAEAITAIEAEIERSSHPDASPGLLVSAISCWEVAMLVSRGRLSLSLDRALRA